MPEALRRLTLLQWIEPPVLIVTVLLMVLYLMTVDGPLKAYFPGATPVSKRQRMAFLIGLGLLYLGFGGPLDVLADGYLFSAHMTQHLLEAFGSAPLFLLGTPAWLIRPVLEWRPTGRILKTMTRPMVGFFSFATVMGLTAWPQFYDVMITNGVIHFLYHAAVLITALAAWWPTLSPLPELPRVHPGMRMLYLTASGLPMLAIFAPIALDTSPFYTYYLHTPRVFGLSPVADQQLGAIIMLAGAHIPVGIAFVYAFFDWTRQERAGTIDIIHEVKPLRPSPMPLLGPGPAEAGVSHPSARGGGGPGRLP